MTLIRALTGMGLVLALTGCMLIEAKETTYLRSARDRATQADVQQRWGPPRLISSTLSGDPVWVYEVREEEPGSRWTSIGLWCDQYALTFDKGGILRNWTHKSELHGGELMPAYCVPNGYSSAW